MTEKEIKVFPECISRKLISLRQEGISQDIRIEPVLVFIKPAANTPVGFEKVMRTVKEEAFSFRGEILNVFPDGIVVCFNLFKSVGYEIDNALIFAHTIVERYDFIDAAYITRKKGVFRYINLKGREFVLVDTPSFSEFFTGGDLFKGGVFLDEEIYSILYHNVLVDAEAEKFLKVKELRRDYIFQGIPVYQGKNPLITVQKKEKQHAVFLVKGKKGVGKTRAVIDAMFEGDFDIVARVGLVPGMQYIPYSAIESLSKSFGFYIKRDGDESFIEHVKRVIQDRRKKAIYVERVEFMDEESKIFLREIMLSTVDNKNVLFLEGDIDWDEANITVFDEYSESIGLKILKSVLAERKPDRTIVDLISVLEPINYTVILDFFNIFSFKKYFIFGEDTVYLSPLANNLKNNFRIDELYDILFRSLSKEELDALLWLALNGGRVDVDKFEFSRVARLARHGIVRIGPYVEIPSSELKARLLSSGGKDRIKQLVESHSVPESSGMRVWHFTLMGENRAAFRELSKLKEKTKKNDRTRKTILEGLLEFEPTEREKVDILLELYDWARLNGEETLAQDYINRALKVAKSLRDGALMANVLYTFGKFNVERNQPGAALLNLKDAFRFSKEEKNDEIRARILLEIAGIYVKKKNRDKLLETLNELERLNLDGMLRAKYLFKKAIYNIWEEKLNRAHSVLEEAFNIAREYGNKELLARIMSKMAEVEIDFGQVKVARRYAENALQYLPDSGEAKLVLSKAEFMDGNIEKAGDLLHGVIEMQGDYSQDAMFALVPVLAYKGHYEKSISYLNLLLNDRTIDEEMRKKSLIRKARYYLRLGRYKMAHDIALQVKDEELDEEFNLFLMGNNHMPKVKTPYIDAVMAFTTMKKTESLDFSPTSDYDYIDAGWMVMFSEALRELLKGNYERAYDKARRILNGYFRASLSVNIAKYIISRGGDGDHYIKEAGELAEKEGYLEVLMWIYQILGKKDRAYDILSEMFEDAIELRDNYIQARGGVL